MLSCKLAAPRAWRTAPSKSTQRPLFSPTQHAPARPRLSTKYTSSSRHHSTHDAPPAADLPSKPLITLTVGAATIIFAGMRYAEDSRLERMYTDLQKSIRQNLGTGLAAVLTPEIDRVWLGRKLSENFILRADDPERHRYFPILGCAFAHIDTMHFVFNMVTLLSIGQVMAFLPRATFGGLIIGSALSSSCAWLYGQQGDRRRNRQVLGSSGIVSGVFTAGALMFPTATVGIFGVVPVPFIVACAGYIALDTYLLNSEDTTGVAHAGHIGGTAFGAAFYAVFLRRRCRPRELMAAGEDLRPIQQEGHWFWIGPNVNVIPPRSILWALPTLNGANPVAQSPASSWPPAPPNFNQAHAAIFHLPFCIKRQRFHEAP
ncbi:MAG: hypothetical protein M1831_006567 [Alyxoria varia]|nr:MAG: hypothetical protein M1831_006567 [Alyxoria varia]